MFTCVLDGFSDLIMLAWAFRAVLFILLGFVDNTAILPTGHLQSRWPGAAHSRGGSLLALAYKIF